MSENVSQFGGMAPDRNTTFTESIKGTLEASAEAATNARAVQEDVSLERLEQQQTTTVAFANVKLQRQPAKDVKSIERVKRVQGSAFVRKEEADELADQFSGRQGNKEYQLDPRILSQIAQDELGAGINEKTTPEEMIAIITQRMSINGRPPDVAMVDKAFEFLLEITTFKLNNLTTEEKPRIAQIYKRIETAKSQHFESNKVNIEVAQKIIGIADSVSKFTGEEIKDTLDLYRGRIHNPPDLQTLRRYYEEKGRKYMKMELKGWSAYISQLLTRNVFEVPEMVQINKSIQVVQAINGVDKQSKLKLSTAEHFLEVNGVIHNDYPAAPAA